MVNRFILFTRTFSQKSMLLNPSLMWVTRHEYSTSFKGSINHFDLLKNLFKNLILFVVVL